MKLHTTAFLLLYFPGLSACIPSTKTPFVRNDFRDLLDIVELPLILSWRPVSKEKASAGAWLPIWRRGAHEVVANSALPRELSLRAHGSPMVMVSFDQAAPLAGQLHASSDTILWNPGTTRDDGFALMEVTSMEKLERIAELAHDRPGLSCGLVQYVSGEPLLLTDNYVPPEYIESVKLVDVATLLAEPSGSEIRTHVQALEAMGTRFHSLPSGLQTSAAVQEMMLTAGKEIAALTVTLFDHSSTHLTTQKSVIATIPGEDPSLPAMVIGAHLDSINPSDETTAPGADDDASGIATLVEVLRVIGATQAKFTRTIEFHGYAAEEIGLIGSANIAQTYRTAGRKIAAMFQLDMVSWSTDPNDLTIHLVTNDTSAILRRSLKELIKTYLDGKYEEDTLKAGTSDHKSWTNWGFNAVFPFEHPINHNAALHTANDTLATINNIPLATQFAKLTLAFLGHHAGLISAKDAYEASLKNQTILPGDDIKIAVIPRETGVSDIAAATTKEAEKVETCHVSDLDSMACADSLIQLFAVGEKGEKRFFINNKTQAQSISDGEIRRFFAYDKNDHAISQRTLTIRKR